VTRLGTMEHSKTSVADMKMKPMMARKGATKTAQPVKFTNMAQEMLDNLDSVKRGNTEKEEN
jgi:hypothetical protein